jgi:hypothetical protein
MQQKKAFKRKLEHGSLIQVMELTLYSL